VCIRSHGGGQQGRAKSSAVLALLTTCSRKLSTPLLENDGNSALLRPDRHPPLAPPLDFT